MPEREPADVTNLDRYGNAPLPWSRPHDLLTGSVPGPEVAMFLSTTRPDGRPHTAGIGALWHDGDLYFTSNPDTRKSRDLAANPACTIAMRLPGIDLVFDGEATRTTDPALLEAVTALFREGGWPAKSVATTRPRRTKRPSASGKSGSSRCSLKPSSGMAYADCG